MGEGGYEDLSSKEQTKTGKRRALSKYELHMNTSYEDQELKDNFRKAFEERQAFCNGRILVLTVMSLSLIKYWQTSVAYISETMIHCSVKNALPIANHSVNSLNLMGFCRVSCEWSKCALS
jgi:hypothetical protein